MSTDPLSTALAAEPPEPAPTDAPAWLALLDPRAERDPQTGTRLAADAYDRATWLQTLRASRRLQHALTRAREQEPTAPTLLEDLFLSFYKAAPTWGAQAPSLLDQVYRRLLCEVFQTREWEELRATGTPGDPVLSALGTLALGERLLSALDEETRQQIARLAQSEEALRQLLQQARVLDEAAGEQELAGAERLAALAEQRRGEALARATADAALLAELPARLEQQRRVVREQAREGLREAMQTGAEVSRARASLERVAGSQAGALDQAPPREKLELAERLQRSRTLREIALVCGRLLPFAHAVQQARMEETPSICSGVTLGRELRRLLPSELALWDEPETERLFLTGFVQQRLWQYEMGCPRLEGQGPIIVALDSSGSMAAPLAGQSKEIWSKAVALCLLSIAREQARDIAILHFSGGVTTYCYARGQASLVDLAQCATHFDRGSTSFEPWMREALRLVDTARFDRADVIAISDGLSALDPEVERAWNRRRREREMRVFAILLEEEPEAREQGAAVLARIADTTLPLATLTDDPALAAIFAI